MYFSSNTSTFLKFTMAIQTFLMLFMIVNKMHEIQHFMFFFSGVQDKLLFSDLIIGCFVMYRFLPSMARQLKT